MSFFINTVNGKRRLSIYYDADIITDPKLVSISLLTGEDIPMVTHYNTIFLEEMGTSGTQFQKLSELCLNILPAPSITTTVGASKVKPNTTQNYQIIQTFDLNNDFNYNWYVDGNATFSNGTQQYMNGGKHQNITFGNEGVVTLTIEICNKINCCRKIYRNIYIGITPQKFLILSNSY